LQPDAILEGLNPEQRRAVETTEGALLVLAGAGSGKTRVLTHRIAYLIGVCGIPPESILAVTFTNKAAGEMRERVQKLLGPVGEGVWLSTFHSTCVRILRRDIGHLGFSRGFAIYDQADSLGLVKEALRRKGLDGGQIDPRRMDWRIDQWKNAGIWPAQAADQAQDFEMERAAEIYALYQRLLAEANALDFGDLLMRTVELFERLPDVLAHYRRRWQYVLIDEYQDTNRVQYRLVQQLAEEHGNLCVVGDPDQSVYAWRGADVRNILEFEQDYPEVATVRLERNYRSTQSILEGASGVIAHNVARKEKRLFTEREGGSPIRVFEAMDDRVESQWVVREILGAAREHDRAYGNFAIFYRTNAQSRLFEEELLKYNVPHVVVGGVRFYERAEVKDALAYLRLLVNPADAMGLRRVINRPARGIGRTTVERAAALADERGVSLLEGLQLFGEGGGTARTAPKVRGFLQMLQSLREELEGAHASQALARLLDRSGYLAALEKEATPEAEARLENLELPRPGGPGLGPGLLRPARSVCLADDGAHGQGARVPGGVRGGARGGDLPARRLHARRAGHRGGAQALLRGHDARHGAAQPELRPGAAALRLAQLQRPVAFPTRNPRVGLRDRTERCRASGLLAAWAQRRNLGHHARPLLLAGEPRRRSGRRYARAAPHLRRRHDPPGSGRRSRPEAAHPLRQGGREDHPGSLREPGTRLACCVHEDR
jgi:DNA helicase-2/ATP-dependent DNA helicase PcrA